MLKGVASIRISINCTPDVQLDFMGGRVTTPLVIETDTGTFCCKAIRSTAVTEYFTDRLLDFMNMSSYAPLTIVA
jgi:hypothetical protein